ncbi:metal ABC transporter permease [bacterium]|nr:metal ABC transporter permease [bacterium]
MASAMELQWMLLPFLACLVLSIIHVYLGIHVIARKVIFVDLALAQIAALGATYATTLGYDPYGDSLKVSLFSLLFTFVGAVVFAIARMRKEKVPQEAFIGIIYAAATAASILILSKSVTGGEELRHMLVGDLLLVSRESVLHVAILYAFLGVFHILFRKKFIAISIDPEAAEASGIRVRFWDVLFYMSFGVVITKSVTVVGVLLVFSYLVVPAVVAQMWATSVSGRLFLGWGVAILASTAGIVWSFYSDYPTGPAVVVMLTFSLILSSIVYYLRYSVSRAQAVFQIGAMAVFLVLFFFGLSQFKKVEHTETRKAPVDLLLGELKEEDQTHQLDAVQHLGEMHDSRIVPALTEFLEKASSEQLVEATIEALAKQSDPRAISALREAAKKDYDEFMKLSIANAQLKVGDAQGVLTLIRILETESGAFARQQAADALGEQSGVKFGYNAEKSVAENAVALRKIRAWWENRGSKLKYNKDTGKFE